MLLGALGGGLTPVTGGWKSSSLKGPFAWSPCWWVGGKPGVLASTGKIQTKDHLGCSTFGLLFGVSNIQYVPFSGRQI